MPESKSILELVFEDEKCRSLFFILFKSNAYYSYIASSRSDTWHDFSNSIKAFLNCGDINKLRGNLSAIIDGIFKAWARHLNFDLNVLDSVETHKIFQYLEQLTFENHKCFKYGKEFDICVKCTFSNNKNQEWDDNDFDLARKFHDCLYSFYDFENSAINFFNSSGNNICSESISQYMTVSCECYQEIYHSFAHLVLDTKSSLSEKIENAQSHVNRSHLDFLKMSVAIKGTINSDVLTTGKYARYMEMQNIGNPNKQTVLKMYDTIFKRSS